MKEHTMTEFTVYGSHHEGTVQRITVDARTEGGTQAEAEALVAAFPKAAGLRVLRLHHPARGDAPKRIEYIIEMRADLTPTKGNDRNETGCKRYRAFAAAAAKLGHTLTHVQRADAATDEQIFAATAL